MEAIVAVPAEAKLKLEFAYDWQGRRIKKTVAPWNSGASSYDAPTTTTKFVYDGWSLVAEVVNGVIERRYIWGPDLSGSLQGAGGVGGLVAMLPTGKNWQIAHSDANGNVTMLVDAKTGAVTAEYEYGPFGEVVRKTGAMADENPFRFSTKYEEAESGLLYYGYRFYNAGVGRWVNRDPRLDAAFSEGASGTVPFGELDFDYVFNRNNALIVTDYLGLFEQCENCGTEAGAYFTYALGKAKREFEEHKKKLHPFFYYNSNCNRFKWIVKWDFGLELLFEEDQGNIDNRIPCGTGKCDKTVRVFGTCHHANSVNYALFGLMSAKCGASLPEALAMALAWKTLGRPFMGDGLDTYKEFDLALRMFLRKGYSFGKGHAVTLAGVPGPSQYNICGNCPHKRQLSIEKFASETKWPYEK